MRFTSSLVALVAATGAGLVSATNTTVMVAANGALTFTPDTVTAAAGDFVVFQFQASGHSATQSSFQAPCTALSGGVNSGFSSVTSATLPTFSYAVKDTNPVWFMCSQVGHCAAGMVFAINPNSTETFAAFQAGAKSGTAPVAATGASSSTAASGSTPAAATTAASTSKGYGSGARESKAASVGLSALALGLTALAFL
ncbi:hypothetical protein FRB96_002391 [Tulasnella sp. 330]|nr:hypothetical protein FRB96_002391 [Tulasnella sp. 330]